MTDEDEEEEVLIKRACKDIRRRLEKGEKVASLSDNQHFICEILRSVFQSGKESK